MLTLALCVLLCVCVYVFRVRSKSNAHELPPAYSGALPIIGHTHILLTDTAKLWLRLQHVTKEAIYKGGVIYVKLGTQIYYVIADAQDAYTAANSCLQKHFAYDFAKLWLGNGLLIAPEHIWKHHRKIINPAFSLPVIHGFLDVFNSQARKMVRIMESHIGQEAFNPHDYLRQITLESFCLATFGNEVEDKDVTDAYMTSLDTVLSIITNRFQKFWLHNDLLFRLSGLSKKLDNTVEHLKLMSIKIIERKKAAMNALNNTKEEYKSTGMKYKTACELLLEQSEYGTLSDEEIREELDSMIAPGFETLANEMVYTLMFIGSHQNVQNKMVEEILEVVGPIRDVEKEDLNRLVYINAVIMESLRMIPLVPALLRYVDKDVKLKNYTMRAGSQCIICPLVNQHDPTWGPSGDKFLPERWLNDPKLIASKEFAGFGLGKRSCIGRQYAIVAMKTFLAHLLRHYNVTADISNLKFKIDFVLKAVAGSEIKITRRDACKYQTDDE